MCISKIAGQNSAFGVANESFSINLQSRSHQLSLAMLVTAAYVMPVLSKQKYFKYFIPGMPACHISATDVASTYIIYIFVI